MGLFGLFASMVGLGAMAKDSISEAIETEKSYQKAKETGAITYYGAGSKQYDTRTGRQISMVTDYATGHSMMVDTRTRECLGDYTLLNNRKKYEEEKRSIPKECVFRRIPDYDCNFRKGNIWVTDKMPGQYFCYIPESGDSSNGYTSEVTEKGTFWPGKIVDKSLKGWKWKTVERSWKQGKYSIDGKLIT